MPTDTHGQCISQCQSWLSRPSIHALKKCRPTEECRKKPNKSVSSWFAAYHVWHQCQAARADLNASGVWLTQVRLFMISLHSASSFMDLALNTSHDFLRLWWYRTTNWCFVTTSWLMPRSSNRPLWIQARVLETFDETSVLFLGQHRETKTCVCAKTLAPLFQGCATN